MVNESTYITYTYYVILIRNLEDPTFWLGKVDDFGIRFG